MPRAAAIIDVTTPAGTVRVTLPATEPDGPGLARIAPVIDTDGEDVTESADIIPIRRSV